MPASAEQRQRERAQEHHVLAADGEQVREPRVAPVVARQRVDRLVLAEHHPAQERRLVGRQPGCDRALGAAAGGIDGSGDPAAARARRLDLRQVKLVRDAAPAQVRRPVEARALGAQRRLRQPADPHDRARLVGPAPPLVA